jgi:hypothetical protein
MNTSPITAKERGRLILEKLKNAPKKPGRPRMVKIAGMPKKRGRPRRLKDKFFTEDCSNRTLKLLSLKIAAELRMPPSLLTCMLAEAAVAYKATTSCRKMGPLAAMGKTNRSNIHYLLLLWDIAHIFQRVEQGNANELLGQINGYNEDRAKAKGKPSTAKVDKYARAVLAALGEKYTSSLRRQATNARKIQKVMMI